MNRSAAITSSSSNSLLPTLPLELLDRLILDTNRDLPLHAQLRRGLRAIIEECCHDGQKFFTEPQLIDRLNISQSTVRRALLDLAREGVLLRRVAKGSFVLKNSSKPKASFTVHVILPEWNSEFFMCLLEALAAECHKIGWKVQVHHTHRGDRIADAYKEITGSPANEGVILLGNEASATLSLDESFSERSYRVVNIHTVIGDYPGQSVGTSNAAIVRTALDHLESLGHRAITLLINESEERENISQRVRVFQEEIAARGLTEARVFSCCAQPFEDGFGAAYRNMPEVMALALRPTAIMTISDGGAWAALKWLAENKIAVPAQVSVMGFGDDRPSRFTQPALTTVAHPITKLAQGALRLFNSGEQQQGTLLLTPELVIRESTGAVASVAR